MQVQKSFKGQSHYGTLYLVPTPIGPFAVFKLSKMSILFVRRTRAIRGYYSNILRLRPSSILFTSIMLMRKFRIYWSA